MDDSFQIINESGDHKYFTIIPNYILNHSTATAQALYAHLKRLAGDNGVAFPGSRYLMDKLGISYNTLKKEMAYLVEKNWIEYVGERSLPSSGGSQKVKAYKMVDLWGKNLHHYERGVKIDAPVDKGVSKRGVKIATKEELLQEDKYTATSADFRIEEDTPDRPQRVKVLEGYKTMLRWAESRRGFPFLAVPKQYKALKLAKDNGIKSAPLKERWVEFESKEFWKDNGFDWMDVVMSFNKRA